MIYNYRAKITRVIDGDTVVADIDLGMGVWNTGVRIRLYGIDTPEMDTIEGETAKSALIEYEEQARDVRIQTIKDKKGSFGRYLGILFFDGVNINDRLLDEKLAERYRG